MTQNKKIFPLRLNEIQHKQLKAHAEANEKSMHKYVLDAIENEAEKSVTYELMKRAYNFIQGGPAPKLEEEIFEWLLNNK